MTWLTIASAPRDGQLILLACWDEFDALERSEHPTEDDPVWRTIGHNNLRNTEMDEWEMAGWCWCHDHFTAGHGTPTHWMPLPEKPA